MYLTSEQIGEYVLQHISAANTNLNGEFMRFNNSERVRFAYDLLEELELLPRIGYDVKNDDLSKWYREQGNKKYKENKVKDAFDLYTKSIQFGTSDGDHLGFGFGNRSAVLFEMGLYKECVKDIENALRNLSDVNHNVTRSKLMVRKGKSLEALDQTTLNWFEPLPTDSNTKLVQKSSEEFGRNLVASEDVEIGDILLIEEPFSVLLVDRTHIHCHECLKLCYCLIPCAFCTTTLYCSKECSVNSWMSYHRNECTRLKCLKSDLQLAPLKIFALKLSLICLHTKSDLKYTNLKLEQVLDLVTNEKLRTPFDLFRRALDAALLQFMVTRRSPEALDETNLNNLLMYFLQAGPSNFHDIIEMTMQDHVLQPLRFGIGVYPKLSLINHSCAPNVIRSYHGTRAVLRAICPLSKGEQCFDNYGYHYAMMQKEDRQMHLKSQYLFDCECRACRNQWDLYENLIGPSTIRILNPDGIKRLSSGDINEAKKLLQILLDPGFYSNLKEPSSQMCLYQECLKQCYNILGNRELK